MQTKIWVLSCYKMIPDLLSPLMVLLSFVHLNTGEPFQKCSYFMEITPGEQCFVFNTDFPDYYPPGSNCEWFAYSDRPMKLSCDPFEIPFVSSHRCNSIFFHITNFCYPSEIGKLLCYFS